MYFTTPGPLNCAEAHVRIRIDRAFGLARNGELGASAIEWVIISAVLILITTVVGGLIFQKIRDKANGLNLDSTGP